MDIAKGIAVVDGRWRIIRERKKTTTCDAKLKFGPGDRFLLGTGGALLAPPPEFEPFLFRRLLAGLC